jgi:adenosylcobinamide kinase/adenosylcobinamide-phosphate guanylyltransferase
MALRIAEHQKRRGSEWVTIEEPIELADVLLARRNQIDCAVVDCLTLWLSNLLIRSDKNYVEEKVETLINVLPHLDFHVVLVTNEVGWGIVPDNPLARQFRDLAGWVNQRMAAIATEVILTVAGIPLVAKKQTLCS